MLGVKHIVMVTLVRSFVVSVIDVKEDDLHEYGHVLNIVANQLVFIQFEDCHKEHEDEFGYGQRPVDEDPPKTKTLEHSKSLEQN